jgi:hypothetical protein
MSQRTLLEAELRRIQQELDYWNAKKVRLTMELAQIKE